MRGARENDDMPETSLLNRFRTSAVALCGSSAIPPGIRPMRDLAGVTVGIRPLRDGRHGGSMVFVIGPHGESYGANPEHWACA